jgi:hypothetical protein
MIWAPRTDTPKSEAGERTIALASVLADELFQHRGRSGSSRTKTWFSVTNRPADVSWALAIVHYDAWAAYDVDDVRGAGR